MTLKLDYGCDGTHGYYIAWYNEDEGIEGDLRIGEKIPKRDQEGELADHFYIGEELRKLCPPDTASSEVLYWDNLTDLKKALKMARHLWKEWKTAEKPWPDWARQAAAAGWKPPKGWKP